MISLIYIADKINDGCFFEYIVGKDKSLIVHKVSTMMSDYVLEKDLKEMHVKRLEKEMNNHGWSPTLKKMK